MLNCKTISLRSGVWTGLLLLVCIAGCTGSWVWPFSCFESCPPAGVYRPMRPARCIRRTPLDCYGYHSTCWFPWPGECGVCESPYAGEQPESQTEAAQETPGQAILEETFPKTPLPTAEPE
ncbi:MAG: hypothetical protein ACUVUC_09955 [Thermoguttaceae bacterium]